MERLKQKDPLTTDNAKQLFIQSFRFSQGDESLQVLLFQYLHIEHPLWKIRPRLRREVFEASKPAIERFVHNRSTHRYAEEGFAAEKSISDLDILEPLNLMRIIFSESYYKNLLDEETLRTVFNDHYYMTDLLNPLPVIAKLIKEKDEIFRQRGRSIGHFNHYSVEGHSTGTEDFDQMFKRLRDY